MNKGVQQLYTIARKPLRRIIGLMSGTSLDGLDIALCELEGHGLSTRVSIPHFTTIPYNAAIRDQIRKVFARDQIDFRTLCLLNPWLADLHATMILQALAAWKIPTSDIDLIASHGQTVYHAPRILHGLPDFPDATLQIGDGDHIAAKTGIITISDFRQKHIAAGGEGAPLALYGDYLLFSKQGEDRIMLNMGGIANFTFLSGSLDPKAAIVTDTGPGNTLIDAFTQRQFGLDYDKDAALAKQGRVNESLLKALMNDPFFKAPFPKTTGPELFNLDYLKRAQTASATSNITPHDILATLTRLSADSVISAIQRVLTSASSTSPSSSTSSSSSTSPSSSTPPASSTSPASLTPPSPSTSPASSNSTLPVFPQRIYISGGGAHNPLLSGSIAAAFPHIPVQPTDALGVSADAKEALLFAILANEAVSGQPIDFGRPSMPATTMGKISFPIQ